MIPEIVHAASLNLKEMADDQLREEFRRTMVVTGEALQRAAVLLEELDRRGQDVDGVDQGLLIVLRRIASGNLLPDIVVRFSRRPKTMQRAIGLPLIEQARLLADQDAADLFDAGCYSRAPRKDKPFRMPRGPLSDAEKAETERERRVKYDPLDLAAAATVPDLAEMIVAMLKSNRHGVEVLARILRDPAIEQLGKKRGPFDPR